VAKGKTNKKMKNNIDKIFKESLQNYERQPRPQAWEKLQERLEGKDRKIVPLWWKYVSAASVALLLGVGGYLFLNENVDSTEQVAVSKKPVIKKNTPLVDSKDNNIELSSNDVSENSNLTSKNKIKFVKRGDLSPTIIIDEEPKIVHEKIEYPSEKLEGTQTTKIPTIEPKKTEENTIVLVLENTKPKVEEETIILNFVETKPEVVAQNTEPEKKQSRVGKIWEQLKRAKNGENVNWNEVGVKPQKVLARADAKIENVLTKGESEK
jgi:hypothetical protein